MEIDVRFIKYLLNIKILNYLKEQKLIDNETYEKSRVQIEQIAQL